MRLGPLLLLLIIAAWSLLFGGYWLVLQLLRSMFGLFGLV